MLSVGLDSLWNVQWCVERWVRLAGMWGGVLSVGLDPLWNVEWCVERWVRLFVECGVVCVGFERWVRLFVECGVVC